jgi:divalent metal cation (Fe/Co/Zn/Cd) transporter
MKWRPTFIQSILLVGILLSGLIGLLSIGIERSLTIFGYASGITFLFIGIFLIYTGYRDQVKSPSERSPLSAFQQPLIGMGVMTIFFVLLLTILAFFHSLR